MTRKQKKMLFRILVSAVLLVAAYLISWKFLPAGSWISLLLFLVPYAVIGWDVLYKAARGIINGQVFDSSVNRGEPATFPLNRVIPGWTEGVQLMKEGAKYTFFIPSDLAYGPQGVPGAIPPHSTLIFDVELIKVMKK